MNKINGFIKKKYDDTKAYFNKVPQEKQFKKNGKLSPQEFLDACDKLIQINPIWQWGTTVDNKKVNEYLPLKKQFIKTEIICCQRLNDCMDQEGIFIYENFDMEDLKIDQNQIKKNIEQQETSNKKKIVINSDSESDDQKEQEQLENDVSQEKKRTYNFYVNYDMAEQVPRFWISGIDYKNQPLTEEQIYEDIVQEYAQKTVTKEYNPYAGVEMIYIHPCRHAEAMLYLYNKALEHNNKLTHKHYMLLFFKFISSIMPTIQFDFTDDIDV